MYQFIIVCDECKKELYRGSEDKLEACKHVKEQGGYVFRGIHLCLKCNTPEIKYHHIQSRQDMYN